MKSKMPIVIRIIALIAGLLVLSLTIVKVVDGILKFEVPDFTIFIVLSALLLVVAIVLPLICRRKLLIGLIIVSSLSLITSTALKISTPALQEALDETRNIIDDKGSEPETNVDIVSDPDATELTGAQMEQRANHIWNNTKSSPMKNMQFDRTATVQRRVNRQTDLYKSTGERKDEPYLAAKKFPNELSSGKNFSLYSAVDTYMPIHYDNRYTYWANGPIGFTIKKTTYGTIEQSHYKLDAYTYFCAEGLIEKEEYRLFLYPHDESDQIYDSQRIYKYELLIHSK